ncbi:hypothetical protein EN974_37470 [Mesorhizobium sp. M7A.F.Ca.CA.001.12.2.1]|nr:hypothetical protein EN974_37470 [Mesorhizobium sp. M7A.F.Ca.CA.001.12.2.1]
MGAGVKTTRAGQVAIGAGAATYTFAGVNSAASKAAQSGPTYLLTSDGAGNLATSGIDIGQIAGLDNRVSTLENGFSDLNGRIDKAFEGTAMALAMAGGSLPADKNFAVSINWGTFEGQNAFAGTAHARLTDNLFINGGVGASDHTVGGRAGLMLAW